MRLRCVCNLLFFFQPTYGEEERSLLTTFTNHPTLIDTTCDWLELACATPSPSAKTWAVGTGLVAAIAAQLALAKGGGAGPVRFYEHLAAQRDRGRCFIHRALTKVKTVKKQYTAPNPQPANSAATASTYTTNTGSNRGRTNTGGRGGTRGGRSVGGSRRKPLASEDKSPQV